MDSSIRDASDEEALEILRDKTVLPFLSVYPDELISVEKYILGERALLVVIPDGDKVEVHIACRRKQRAGLREYLERCLEWLRRRGFNEVTTTAPKERVALCKMLESLGFRDLGDYWSYTWV